MLLILVTIAGGYAFFQSANSQFNKAGQDAKIAASLLRAKEALIARAVTDSNRPGSLPCPDLVTNSPGLNNTPGDGKADMFAMTQCPSYVGWLPWVTLDLPELTDDVGARLWYILSPALKDDDSAHPINSDTAMALDVDGSSDIAALIIAPRTPLVGQNRPSNNPADYLDGENGNGNDHKYVTGPRSDSFNDMVLVITRQELMAAVEKRVANEVSSCLNQHAASQANTDHRYPWPAPFSSSGFQGKENSFFGRVPSTQPGSGPEAALKSTIARLTLTVNQLGSAANAGQQLVALNALGDTIVQARNLFNAIFLAGNQLKQLANTATSLMTGIDEEVDSAAINGRISVVEGRTIRELTSVTDSALESLRDAMASLGVDVMPWQLTQLASALGASANSIDLLHSTEATLSLLNATVASHPLAQASFSFAKSSAETAYLAAVSAVAAAGSPAEITLQNAAKAAATTLSRNIIAFGNSIEASRVNVLASEAISYIAPLESAATALRNTPNAENIREMQGALAAAKASVTGIVTGVQDVSNARSTALASLQTAESAATAPVANYAAVDAGVTAAIADLNALVTTISNNQAFDNNVTHTSLTAAINTFMLRRTEFNQLDTADPRPVQTTITPYANRLGNAAVDIDIWAKIISANAALVAPLAKASPVAANVDPGTAVTLDASAYALAGNTLSSITGKNASISLLQAYIDNPSASNQAKAIAALSQTTALANSLLAAANTLDTPLSGTTATAFPIVWNASRCDFMLPTANWWTSNQWSNTVFYQISSPTTNQPGKLTINGAGNHRVVVLAAGRLLAGQTRGPMNAAAFFEGINADPSRNGNANSPATAFTSAPPSATFNDRLAN
ncbi:MAG: hypothetical protein JNJ95_08145 [Dechloromonas sp.]|nr:hypothetical protein [Dechloromonas sp.]